MDRHHVVAISEDKTLRLDRDNIMNLCRECHTTADELRVKDRAKYLELMMRASKAAAGTPGGVFF